MGSFSIPYTSVPQSEERFAEPLDPVTQTAFLFGADAIYDTPKQTISTIYFVVMFVYMVGVACVAVFVRTSIDLWIQFSLYIVPVITIMCGRRFFNSVAFRELLYRLVQSRAMLSSSIPDLRFTNSSEFCEIRSSGVRKRNWLRSMALKCCLYPLFIEVIQWSAYGLFKYVTNKNNFAGNEKITAKISPTCWIVLYSIFWSLGVYQVGLLTFQFILVSNIVRRDALSLMELYGDSPFLWIRKSHLDEGFVNKPSCWRRMIRGALGVVLMDALNDPIDLTNFVGNYAETVTRSEAMFHTSSRIPARCFERLTPLQESLRRKASIHDQHEARGTPFKEGQSHQGNQADETSQITPEKASVILAHFVTDIQEIMSSFVPFTTAMLFFSLTNLITHACIFALNRTETRHWWTLARTMIWLLLTVRIIMSVYKVTKTLSQIAPHVKYLRASGLLYGEDIKWERFMALTEHFKLNERSFGFPLTLKQLGIMTAFLKMTFLVILSLMKAEPGGSEAF